jgi:hypothetical protein
METSCELPIFAVERLPCGSWLVRAPIGDPLLPAVCIVDVIDESENREPLDRQHAQVLTSPSWSAASD